MWKHFQVDESEREKIKPESKPCSAKLSRATKSTTYNTSNFRKHLKSPHNAEWKEFTRRGTGNVVDRRGRVGRKCPEATRTLSWLSCQSLSVADGLGFRRLICVLESRYDIPSRHNITDMVLPKLHESGKKKKPTSANFFSSKKNSPLT